MKAEVTKLFDHFADNAESYGAENLYLARRDEGYVGDPKEFRFSEIYARRIPTYKHELIVDYIDEASTLPHAQIGRRLTTAEADWMRRQAKKLYEDERAHAMKSAQQGPAHAAKRVSMPAKKKTPQRTPKKVPPSLPMTNPLDTIRRLMWSTGFDEEEAYGQRADQVLFSSREEGDVAEGRADPGTVRFAREKAKEVEAAVPGAKARVEVVDEWVSISVTLPPGAAPRVPTPESEPQQRPTIPAPPPRQRATLKPGDEVKYTNFTVGGSYEGKAIVTWDHGKSVEARTLPAGEKIRLERATDGSLRRFT